jgi:hypothetical protein
MLTVVPGSRRIPGVLAQTVQRPGQVVDEVVDGQEANVDPRCRLLVPG